jgi:hypothetical protein
MVLTQILGLFLIAWGTTVPARALNFCPRQSVFLHSVDASITEYMVETKDSNDQFKLFLSLGEGSAVQVEGENCPFFLSIAHELGNSDVFTRILDHCHLDFVLRELRDPDFLNFCGESFLGALASAFYQLNSSELDHISVSTHTHILSHNLL